MISCQAYDASKPNTIYLSRQGSIETPNKKGGYTNTYTLRFPISPDTMYLDIQGNCTIDKISSDDLKTCPQWMDRNLAEFLPFCEWFATNAGIFSARVPGRYDYSTYKSRNGNFRIDYYDFLTDEKGNPVNTPARVGWDTGKIEVSKSHFLGYSVPVRQLVLEHEYCHKFVNPLVGRPIGDEESADLQALGIFLNAGNSPVEAKYCYLSIFDLANNDENTQRWALINKFIDDHQSGKLGCSTK